MRPQTKRWTIQLCIAWIVASVAIVAADEVAGAHLKPGLEREVGYTEARRIAHKTHLQWKPRRAHKWQVVISCESKFDKDAVNGRFRGITQMGDDERETYRWHWMLRRQLRASHRYWQYAKRTWGYGWQPWSCRP